MGFLCSKTKLADSIFNQMTTGMMVITRSASAFVGYIPANQPMRVAHTHEGDL